VLPLSPAAWDTFTEPLRWRGIGALTRHLAGLPPEFTQPRHAAGAVRILACDALTVHAWYWDAAAQVLRAEVREAGEAVVLRLSLAHRAVTPHAVDALARVLAGEWGPLRAVAGPARLVADEPWMQPLALLTAERAVIPQIEAAPAHPASLPQNAPPGERALPDDTLDWLTQLLRQGLRHQAGDFAQRIEERSKRLDGAGGRHAARLLSEAGEHWRAGREKTLAALSKFALLAMERERGTAGAIEN
jgi:hypothetical protein